MIQTVTEVDTFEQLEELVAPIMKAVTSAVGATCEVVLHNLSRGQLDSSIALIENGFVTGRSVGGPSTNLGLPLAAGAVTAEEAQSLGYRAHTSDGRELRCSSIYFQDKSGHLLGALCINVDLTPSQLIQQGLNLLTVPTPSSGSDEGKGSDVEFFATDVDNLLENMLEAAIDMVGVPTPMMTKNDRVRVFEQLERKGAFVVKHAVSKTAKRLGVSRVSAYSYLDEVRQKIASDGSGARGTIREREN